MQVLSRQVAVGVAATFRDFQAAVDEAYRTGKIFPPTMSFDARHLRVDLVASGFDVVALHVEAFGCHAVLTKGGMASLSGGDPFYRMALADGVSTGLSISNCSSAQRFLSSS